MIPLGPVVARVRVHAERAAVWRYLVNPGLRDAWWPDAEIDPRLGGAIADRRGRIEADGEAADEARGEIDVWVDGHAVGFRWRESSGEGSTSVLLTLRTQGVDSGVTVTETGFDGLTAAAERAAAATTRWQRLLDGLAEAAGTGAGEATEEPVAVVEAPRDEADEGVPGDERVGAEATDEAVAAEVDTAEVDAEAGSDAASEADAARESAEAGSEADAERGAETDAENGGEADAATATDAVADAAPTGTAGTRASTGAGAGGFDDEYESTIPLVLPEPPADIADDRYDRAHRPALDFDAIIRGE